ncbi:MAG: glycosyltransferase [Candidatus Pacebacteria bacterium]|nr:glycosyltransferase [Candidatus Paceibacterota bacterium]
MERLSKKGHEIRVIDHEIQWIEDKNKELVSKKKCFNHVHKAISDGDITVIRPSIIKLPIIEYLSYIYTRREEIKEQIKTFNPDVIIGFGILNPNIGLKLAKKNNIPFVYYSIDENFRLVPQWYFRRLAKYIEEQNIKYADKALSINEGLREFSICMGAERAKTDVISAGVDIERFNGADGARIRKKYGLKDADIVLFFMGWLYDFSGLKEVAMELARFDNDKIKLMIVGKGDLWEELQNIKIDHCLEGKLILVDWVPYEDIPEYLAASNICILPSYKNNIMRNIVPIKMYEYMATGKPVIASDLYGIMKEFGNNNGVLYVARPEDVLVRSIELVNDGCNEAGRKAKKFVENNNWDALTSHFEEILREIVNG